MFVRMSSIFASTHGLVALAALEQARDGLKLTALARAMCVGVSTAQAAVAALADDGFIERSGAPQPELRLTAKGAAAARSLLDLLTTRHGEAMVRAALRANPSVEFAGLDGRGVLIVSRWSALPVDEAALEPALLRYGRPVDRLAHDEVRERLLDEGGASVGGTGAGGLTQRAHGAEVVVGSVPRSFPDPFRHADPNAPLLDRLHPTVRRPSRRALAAIAKHHGLSEIRVFGSAVHADFREDSDVDVAVRRRPGSARTLAGDLELRASLELLLDRDVDLSDLSLLREPIRARAQVEGVVLYG